MKLTFNGRSLDAAARTVLDLLVEAGIDVDQRGIAVAVNDEVVARADWRGHALHEGDVVEAITAMQGG